MTKVDFTNWLHTELDAVFNGDITPEQVMLNAIPMIDTIFSQNNGKPIVSRSKCDFHAAFTFCGDNGITYCSNCGDPV